jgi:hypothetical protein
MAQTISIGGVYQEERVSWVPMSAIALGQIIMSYNVASLPIAMGGMGRSFAVLSRKTTQHVRHARNTGGWT